MGGGRGADGGEESVDLTQFPHEKKSGKAKSCQRGLGNYSNFLFCSGTGLKEEGGGASFVTAGVFPLHTSLSPRWKLAEKKASFDHALA